MPPRCLGRLLRIGCGVTHVVDRGSLGLAAGPAGAAAARSAPLAPRADKSVVVACDAL